MTRPGVQRTPNRWGEGGRLHDDLLEAALRLVDTQEFGAISLRAVARATGVAAPSIYRHFANLDALMAAVVTRCFDALVEEICTARDGHHDVVERLLGCCRGYLRYAERFPGRYALLFGRAAAPGCTAATVVDQRAFALLVGSVTACLDVSADSAGHPHEMATAIWVGLDGYANLRVNRPYFPWPDPDTMLHHIVLGRGGVGLSGS